MPSKIKNKNNEYLTFSGDLIKKSKESHCVCMSGTCKGDIRTPVLLLSFVIGSLPKQDIKLWFHFYGTRISNMYLSDNI